MVLTRTTWPESMGEAVGKLADKLAAEELAAGPWIPVTEREPPEGTRVLMCGGVEDRCIVGEWQGEWFEERPFVLFRVTHWAEISPPKGTE